MTNLQSKIPIPIRLAHYLGIIILLFLIATGIRLKWLDMHYLPFGLVKFVDKLAPSELIYNWHIYSGIGLIIAGGFYFIFLFVSGESRRLFHFVINDSYSLKRKIFYLITFLINLMAVISGLIICYRWYNDAGSYTFVKSWHWLMSIFIVIIIFIHLFESIFSKRYRLNNIFLSSLDEYNYQGKALFISLFVTALLSLLLFLTIPGVPTLICKQQNSIVIIDGRENIIEWTTIDEIKFPTTGGANFIDGVSEVAIKTFHDIQFIYFLIKWTDENRSYNRFLEKTNGGWIEKRSVNSDLTGENIYFEDQLAVMFQKDNKSCAASCHLNSPLNKGLHYTDSDTADIWKWQAVSTNPVWQADDGWLAAYENAKTGGQHYDNIAAGGHYSNLNREWYQPYFLPQYYAARYWINLKSSAAISYFSEIDTFQIGAKVPAVLVSPFMGDRGDVRARGVWRNGVWTIEIARPLKTGSTFDIIFRDELYFSVAIFNNSEKKHTYHLQPVKLIIE